MIQPAASLASPRGGSASGRRDHSLDISRNLLTYSHASRQRAELEADYSSVRASVRPSVPLLREAQNICFCTIQSEISKNHICILQYLAPVAFKPHHKINMFLVKCSNYIIKLDVEIVNFNTSQLKSNVKSSNINISHLKPYTSHSLTSLCPPCLTFLSLLSSLGSDSTLNHSVTLGRPLFEFILMHLARGLCSKLIIPQSVRASVRPSPSSGKLKTNAFAPYCLKFQKITYVFYST